jgi:hypothetical protein
MKFNFTPPSKPLEPGTYVCKCVDAEEAINGAGNDQIILELRFPGGMKIKDRLTASEKALWRVSQAYTAFGFKAADGETVEVEPADFVGAEVTVRIDKGKPRDDGKVYLEIVEYVAPVPI